MKKLALYEPPFITVDGRPRALEASRRRLEQLLAAGERSGAVKYFLTDVLGAPKAFALAMPLLMRSSFKKNESVAHTLVYDLTILDDWSVLRERSATIAVPTLVIAGERSSASLRGAATAVARALPNGRSRFLKGQAHDVSASAVAPILVEFFKGQQAEQVEPAAR